MALFLGRVSWRYIIGIINILIAVGRRHLEDSGNFLLSVALCLEGVLAMLGDARGCYTSIGDRHLQRSWFGGRGLLAKCDGNRRVECEYWHQPGLRNLE